MNTKKLHEEYHSKIKLQKRIISPDNFTYRQIIRFISKYVTFEKKVLDIGSGVGTFDLYLSDKVKSIIGIDISSRAIAIAKENAKVFGLKNIKYFVGDVGKYKFTSKFDLIICAEIIEHVKDEKKLLVDLQKHLNIDGIIFLTTPLMTAPLHKVGLTKDFDKRVGHLRRYTLDKLKKLTKETDLKIINVYYREGVFRNMFFVFPIFDQLTRIANSFAFVSDIFTFIDNFSLKLFGASNIYLIIKKK
ncbi:hypothetical protein BH10PAT1_BH10PAT1_5720 [soil metagenome]